jgi:adenine-specific DNA-methyltransferase
MKKIEFNEDITKSNDILKDNIKKIKMIFPDVVSEGKVNFKLLSEKLGDETIEVDEFYRFTWLGKSEARNESHKPSTGTLRPSLKDSLNWKKTENLYIEGDNLEVLKTLQKSYSSKIKLIYIDPPYNTGKDFVYKDNYRDNLRNYKELTGQTDSEGNKLLSNPETDGRFHSNWLNMIYPRLILSRNLLSDDGVIMVSIDDHEIENLRKVLFEIFGEENFVTQFIWQKSFSPKNDSKYFSNSHEYIVCVAKKINNFKRNLLPRTEENNKGYKNIDEDPRGRWSSTSMLATTYNEKYVFEVTAPNGKIHLPPAGRCWRYSKEKISKMIDDNRIWFGQDGNNVPRTKRFLTEVQNGIVPQTLLLYKEVGSGQDGTNDLKNVFDGKQLFDFPKPVNLLKFLLRVSTDKNSTILDFFSGSATTAQSLFELNMEENADRKIIQVQLPEILDEKSEGFKMGFKTICDIGKDRMRRVIKNLNLKYPEKSKKINLGFKVFKLDSSNIRTWDGNPDNLKESLFDAVGNIKTDRTEEDVLYEILLKYGLDLTLPIEEKNIEGKKVFNVGLGSLFICLADGITSKVAEGIGQWKEDCSPEICRVIFKDNGFTDVEKTNSVQTLKRYGINEIRSI